MEKAADQVDDAHSQGTLCSRLIQALNNCRHATDQEVAETISHIRQPYNTAQHSNKAHHQNDEDNRHEHLVTNSSPGRTRWHRQATYQQTHEPALITYLHANEWSEQPKLAKWEPLVEAIKAAATLPDSNTIELTSKHAVQELTNLWNAYSPTGSLTLILSGPAKNTPGATHASIRAQRGRGPLRVEDIGLIALGEKQKATWIKTPIKVQSQSLPSTNRCTIRVAAPAEYREAFLEFLEGTDKTKAVVAHMSQFVQDIQTSTLMGGTWTEQWHNNKKHLIGFLHVPAEAANKLTKMSGTQGIFITSRNNTAPTSKSPGFNDKHMKAITTITTDVSNKPSSATQVFSTAKAMPTTTFSPEEQATAKAKQFILKGIPYTWYIDDIQQFLHQQGWKHITAIHKPRYRREWRFTANPPKAEEET